MNRARERFPDLWMPNRSDLCFATTNRQAALKVVAARADAVVVIGSVNSSNTRALEKVARASGCPRVLRVNEAGELPDDLAGTVGVTAGASAPDELVDAVVARLAPVHGVEEVHVTDEDEYFPPPPELRDLLRGLAAALAVGLAAPTPTESTSAPSGALDVGGGAADRHISAADVLARLAG
jgi:4-hydroxy-3-methylbut-2-enyl diphosphate reductase